MQIAANSVHLISGGNVIKQGDETPFTFQLNDETGQPVDLTNANVIVKIADQHIILLEKPVTINEDHTITFNLSGEEVIGSGNRRVEFEVTFEDDTKEIFPAFGYQEIVITQSLSVVSQKYVSVLTVEQLERRVNDATTDANQATDKANEAADRANQATDKANEAADRANTKADDLEDRVNTAIAAGTVDLEVKDARGREKTLGNRLDSFTSQLAQIDQQKPNKGEISIIDLNKNKIKFDQTWMTDAFLQQIIGKAPVNATPAPHSIISSHLVDKSLNARKVSFMETSSNLYDSTGDILDKGIDTTTGMLVDNTTSKVSHFIEVLGNVSYAIYNPSGRYAFYDKDYNLITTAFISGTVKSVVVTSPENAVYLRLVMQKTESLIRVNQSDVLLPYEDSYAKIKSNVRIDKDFIHPSKVFDATSSNAVFYGDSPIIFDLVTKTIAIPQYMALLHRNKRINLPSTNINITSGASFQILFYNPTENKFTLVPSGSGMADYDQYSKDAIGLAVVDLTNIDVYALGNYKVIKSADTDNYVFSPEEIVGDYAPISIEAADGTVTGGFNATTIKSQDVYDKFDALMNAYPNYITKELLGYDSSGTLPIYSYKFNPEIPVARNGSVFKPFPKYIITNGIHGDGSDAGDKPNMVMAMYYFFNDICNHWEESDLLEYLRWNINFVVVPIINPWGFDNKSRRNANQVDLNRNFDYGWRRGSLGSNTYGGTAPFSEVETQYIRDLINANKDAISHVDFHTTGNIPVQNQMIYFDMAKESELYYAARYLISKLSHKWDKRNYPGLNKMNFHGYVVDEVEPFATCNGWVDRVAKIPSCTLEGFSNFYNSGLTTHGLEIMTMNAEEVGNWIWYSLKHFKNKK